MVEAYEFKYTLNRGMSISAEGDMFIALNDASHRSISARMDSKRIGRGIIPRHNYWLVLRYEIEGKDELDILAKSHLFSKMEIEPILNKIDIVKFCLSECKKITQNTPTK